MGRILSLEHNDHSDILEMIDEMLKGLITREEVNSLNKLFSTYFEPRIHGSLQSERELNNIKLMTYQILWVVNARYYEVMSSDYYSKWFRLITDEFKEFKINSNAFGVS